MNALEEPVEIEAIKKLRIQCSHYSDGQKVDALADPPDAHRLSVAEARCLRSP